MIIEVRKVINKNTSLVFGNMKKINKFFIDDNDNLQYKSIGDGKMDDNILLSEVVIEVGHISVIKLKHIKNMIKFPDIVNIEEVFHYDGEILDINHVVSFLLNAIYLVSTDDKHNWIYMSGKYLEKNKPDEDWFGSETMETPKQFSKGREYQISSHVAK